MKAIDTYGAPTAGFSVPASAVNTTAVRENPCTRILEKVHQHILDVNYDKMHHRGICNSDGSLVDPDWYYSTTGETPKEAR
jgi:hypothetical protein